VDVVEQLAMAHPFIGFTVVCDGRTVFDAPPGDDPRTRALRVLGAELAPELLDAHADALDTGGALSLWGLIGKPSLARQASTSLYLFVNGRAVRDKTLQHAAREAYRGLIEPGRWPTAMLLIDIDPSRVDVNVHPAKAEVRFRDQSAVHQGVYRAVKNALERADLTPRLGAPGGSGFGTLLGLSPVGGVAGVASGAASATVDVGFGGGIGGQRGGARVIGATAFADYFKRFVPIVQQGNLSYDAIRNAVQADSDVRAMGLAGSGLDGRTFDAQGLALGMAGTGPAPAGSDVAAMGFGDLAVSGAGSLASDALLNNAPSPAALQVHNSFLVTQDAAGVVIVDQHALHERVMFEKLLVRIGRGSLESQRLLVPAVMKVTARQMESLDDVRPLLVRIGIDAEPMGHDQIAVHSFASFLFERRVEPHEFLPELLDKAAERALPADTEDALRDVLDMMACKAAIKAGDHLSDMELAELLALRDSVERSSNCPHGRPTSVRLSIRDLERLFGRS